MNEYLFTISILIGLYVFSRLINNDYLTWSKIKSVDDTQSIIVEPKPKYIKKGIIIELNNIHYEYIGIAIEYFLKNEYESVDLYLPKHLLENSNEWINFFTTNYKFKIKLNLVEKFICKYDYAFYITLLDEPKLYVDAYKYGGILYENSENTLKYMLNNKHIDQFSMTPLIQTDKYIMNYFSVDLTIKVNPMYVNNYYPEINYFILDDNENPMNISKIKEIFTKLNKKWLYISKKKSIYLYTQVSDVLTPYFKSHNEIWASYLNTPSTILSSFINTNITEIINIHPTALIKCFLHKKCIYLPDKTNSKNQHITSRLFQLGASFNTPFYLPKTILDNYPEYNNFKFIPFNTDNNLFYLLESN